ncbi:MAG TPA: hypothetical protein PLG60_08585 [Acidimicrobiales bacterium]|nr:MAG: hypothetical protein B7X07_04370 [Actinobacteria bacterium 21-64-8]HQU00545.1 hypothetical protein [Acidimicrobiales bacterium]
MARLAPKAALAFAVILSGLALASCGTGGAVADARQACGYVQRALRIQQQSESPGLTNVRRVALENRAIAILVEATPYAARATSIDGSWNPLMTTIGEAQRVPITDLVASLTRLCKVANSSSPYL